MDIMYIRISDQATTAVDLIYRKVLFITSAKLYNFANHLQLCHWQFQI